MWSSKQVHMWACYHQSKDKWEYVINKACEYHAYKHLSTQIHLSLISQSSQHSRKIINAFECTDFLLHNHFNPNHHPSMCTCVWISNMWISMHMSMRLMKHFKIRVGNHQNVQAYELDGIQASRQLIIDACKHGSTLSLWHVINEAR